jgi:phage shock protein PspC (stress-responsive transcriptional regulator)
METTSTNPQADSPEPGYQPSRSQPLTRSVSDRMIAGVAGGIARYLGVDPTIIRIAFAVLTIVGGAGIPIYAAAWLLIPEEGQEQSIAASLLAPRQSRTQ